MVGTEVKVLPRKFKYDNLILDDIDCNAAPEEIMASYSENYPALTGGHVEGPELTEDALIYTFVTKLGTKGSEDEKPIDFGLMREISHTLLQSDEDEPELPPSEVLEVI